MSRWAVIPMARSQCNFHFFTAIDVYTKSSTIHQNQDYVHSDSIRESYFVLAHLLTGTCWRAHRLSTVPYIRSHENNRSDTGNIPFLCRETDTFIVVRWCSVITDSPYHIGYCTYWKAIIPSSRTDPKMITISRFGTLKDSWCIACVASGTLRWIANGNVIFDNKFMWNFLF